MPVDGLPVEFVGWAMAVAESVQVVDGNIRLTTAITCCELLYDLVRMKGVIRGDTASSSLLRRVDHRDRYNGSTMDLLWTP